MKVSNEVKFLEDAFDVLNEKYFESALSKCAITIQSSPIAHGHFTPWEAWTDAERSYNEINLGACIVHELQRTIGISEMR